MNKYQLLVVIHDGSGKALQSQVLKYGNEKVWADNAYDLIKKDYPRNGTYVIVTKLYY